MANQASEKTIGFRALAAVLVPFLSSIAKIEFTDPQKLPKTGAFVLSPNHYSNIDPVIMGWSIWKLGRAPRFLAKASLFRVPVVGAVLRGTGQIPVERAGSVRGSEPLKAANGLVEKGNAVIIYPEGTLTRDPQIWPMRGKTGAVRMALEQNLPLIPAAHWGTQAVMARYSNKISLFPRKTIKVAFGDPVDLTEFRGKPINAAVLTAATELVMADITALLEGLRGETAPVERWNPAAHNQKETGRFE
ncbi:1-acyl-sn-glycerol-3-phosphate acyltransferases [Agreia bicolorata]|uniref:1-acyl-sn-glycerol-3-phosphate acyltransferases n=1 Tax=Agreia bicolorata TaxID=110935 RepID=A0A1T4XYZ8_9MICO|nr:lysophospholipid acyltransferase family protein [Agreia bicolorata]SKA94281.1 1-acyl-sn-glycerol-3-phosphate acyltransferases [Agreia bicolorata]